MPSPYRAIDYQSQLLHGCCREEPGASTNDEEVRPRPFFFKTITSLFLYDALFF
eukprot:COSAG01_NODE_25180_length_753_cov_0.863914_2_plen_53_part_01